MSNIENSVVFEYSWNEHLRDEIDAFADFFEKSKNNELPTYKDISQYYEDRHFTRMLMYN